VDVFFGVCRHLFGMHYTSTGNDLRNAPSADELNEIQRQWMALDCSAPATEKQRVFKLMERLPKSYVSATSDLSSASPMLDGSPIWGSSRPINEAIRVIRDYANRGRNARADVAWVGSEGKWVSI
jgi:hypothetical protein